MVAALGVAGVDIFDIGRDLGDALDRIAPAVVVDTAGPFQQRGYEAARTCIARKIHYIDLSDGRDYVGGVTALDAAARENDVLVVSGASTVPALTSAVVEHLLPRFSAVDFLDFALRRGSGPSAGWPRPRAILGYVGQRLRPCAGYPHRYGWQDLHRQPYPGLGNRWMANCDVPDLDLLPAQYGIKRIRFSAGMELALVHLGLWGLSWLVRAGLPIRLARWAKPLLAVSNLLDRFGSADGGMHVLIEGRGRDGEPLSIGWFIVAKEGHGPYIPAVPSALLATQLAVARSNCAARIPASALSASMPIWALWHTLRSRRPQRLWPSTAPSGSWGALTRPCRATLSPEGRGELWPSWFDNSAAQPCRPSPVGESPAGKPG